MRYRLRDLAGVIRSKNAGPYELTFDVIFRDDESFRLVTANNVINPDMFAALYNMPKSDIIDIVFFPNARAVKVTVVRPLPSGALGERDVYGAQQHGPLADYTFEL